MTSRPWLATRSVLALIAAILLTACASQAEPSPGGGDTETAGTATPDESGETEAEPDADEPVTVKFVNWAASTESTAGPIQEVIDEFESRNPSITIESIPVGVSDIVNQVITMVAGGNPPDVVQSQTLFTPTFTAAGITAQLDDELTVLDQLQPGAVELGKASDGTIHAIPWAVFPLGFHYNRALMSEVGLDPDSPPTTLADMVDQISQALEANENVVGFNLDTTIRDVGLFFNWPLMMSFGAEPISDDSANADTSEMVEFIDWIRMLLEEGYTIEAQKFGDFRPYAADGSQLFIYDGPYFKGIVQGTNEDLTDERFLETWGVTTLPEGPRGGPFTVSSDHHLVVMDASPVKAAATKFAEFLATDPFAIETYVLNLGGIPAVSDLSPYPDLDNEYFNAFAEEITAGAINPPYGEKWAAAAETIQEHLQRVFATSDSSADIAADIQADLQALFDS